MRNKTVTCLLLFLIINICRGQPGINGTIGTSTAYLCQGDSIRLEATNHAFDSVIWVKNPGAGWQYKNAVLYAKDTVFTTYYLYMWQNGSIITGSPASIEIYALPLPNGGIYADTICPGIENQNKFKIINLTGLSPWTIKIYDESEMNSLLGTFTTSLPNNENISFTNVFSSGTRNYYFTITSANGCIKKQ